MNTFEQFNTNCENLNFNWISENIEEDLAFDPFGNEYHINLDIFEQNNNYNWLNKEDKDFKEKFMKARIPDKHTPVKHELNKASADPESNKTKSYQDNSYDIFNNQLCSEVSSFVVSKENPSNSIGNKNLGKIEGESSNLNHK